MKKIPHKVGLWVHMMSGIEKNVKEFHKNKKKNDSQKVKYKFKKMNFLNK